MTDNEPDPTEEKRAWLRALIARSGPGAGGGIFAPKPDPSGTDNNHRSK